MGYPGTIRDIPQAHGDAMEYTLTEAAETTGIGRSTIHRAIQKGRLSARRDETGIYRIDGAELARVFPPSQLKQRDASPWDATGHAGAGGGEPGTGGTAADGGGDAALLRLELRLLKEELARERELRDREREMILEVNQDLRKRLDKAEERILALAPPLASERAQEQPVEAPARVEAPRATRSFLGRLLGR